MDATVASATEHWGQSRKYRLPTVLTALPQSSRTREERRLVPASASACDLESKFAREASALPGRLPEPLDQLVHVDALRRNVFFRLDLGVARNQIVLPFDLHAMPGVIEQAHVIGIVLEYEAANRLEHRLLARILAIDDDEAERLQ